MNGHVLARLPWCARLSALERQRLTHYLLRRRRMMYRFLPPEIRFVPAAKGRDYVLRGVLACDRCVVTSEGIAPGVVLRADRIWQVRSSHGAEVLWLHIPLWLWVVLSLPCAEWLLGWMLEPVRR